MIDFEAFVDELEKISGAVPAALSMGGLAGLTAIEGAGAFNKKNSNSHRLKDAASAGFTGSILAGEAIHNREMLANAGRKALRLLKHGSVDLWHPVSGAITGLSGKAGKVLNQAAHAAPGAASAPKGKFTMDMLRKGQADLKAQGVNVMGRQ